MIAIYRYIGTKQKFHLRQVARGSLSLCKRSEQGSRDLVESYIYGSLSSDELFEWDVCKNCLRKLEKLSNE